MRDAIRDRLDRDAARLRSDRSGNVDVHSLLSGWVKDAEWLGELASVAETERRAALIDVAGEAFDADLGNLRRELEWNAEGTEDVWTTPSVREGLRQHVAHLFLDVSDAAVLHAAPRTDAEVAGVEHLGAALVEGRGVLVMATLQRDPRWLLHAWPFGDRQVVALQHAEGAASSFDLAERVTVLPATRSSIRKVVATVDAGGIVLFANDFVFPGVATIPTTLFGFDVLMSKGIATLAVSRGVPVVPLEITRAPTPDAGPATCRFFDPVAAQRDEHAQALVMGVATECLIRRDPPQWRLWNALRHRIEAAA